jgi:SAM-dependent methyltransferase
MKKGKISGFLQKPGQLDYFGIQELSDGEVGLTGYNLDIVRHLIKELKIEKKRFLWDSEILEFGAGTGVLAQIWKMELGISPICIEIDPKCILLLQAQGFTTYSDLTKIQQPVSIIYSSNVLEHIENDVNELKNMREKLVPGGQLALYVPALPILYSELDKSIGHFRRYTKRELIAKVEDAGFVVKTCYYNDCIGVLGSLALRIFGYKNSLGLGSLRSLIFYDKCIYPLSRILDRFIFKHLIGKNLFLFATSTNDSSN